MARTRLYRDGKLALEDFPVEDISEYLDDEQACVWLDYCSPTAEELATIVEEFQLHVLRATEWTESLRDLVTTILETNLTIQGNRMNLVMKKVTSWAAIIAVPTAITGFYGQNVPYPGFAAHWGFWFSTVLIVVLSGSLYWAFRRSDWI